MKVLVLSCTTGGGHNSCGRYIQSEFNSNNIKCDFVDYFSIIDKKLSKKIESLYLKSTRGKGRVFKKVYKLGETYNKLGITSPVYELNKLSKNKVLEFIKKNNYDIVICSHLFPSMAITHIKDCGYNIKLINVATDYTYIPFWNETDPNYFVIPHKSLKEDFTNKGIEEKVLLPIGIPVSTNFQKTEGTLSLKKDKPNVLVTSGSMGFGNVKDIVKRILEKIDCYVIVLCGNNKKLEEKLLNIKNPNLIVHGFVNNMNDYIKECDVVLTKPGGLTSTEVAVLNKPMVHIMPIPGVENYNSIFFSKNHLSIVCNTIDEIIENTKILLEDKDLQKEIIKNQERVIYKDSAKKLVELIKEQEKNYSQKTVPNMREENKNEIKYRYEKQKRLFRF